MARGKSNLHLLAIARCFLLLGLASVLADDHHRLQRSFSPMGRLKSLLQLMTSPKSDVPHLSTASTAETATHQQGAFSTFSETNSMDERHAAQCKIRQALEALEISKQRARESRTPSPGAGGFWKGANDGGFETQLGVHVTCNATHVTVSQCNELWRELRRMGFNFHSSSGCWVQASPAVVLRAGLSSRHELTSELVVRMLERAFLEETQGSRHAVEGNRKSQWRVWVEEDGDGENDGPADGEGSEEEASPTRSARKVVVVEYEGVETAQERTRLMNAGFHYEPSSGRWVQGQASVVDRTRLIRLRRGSSSKPRARSSSVGSSSLEAGSGSSGSGDVRRTAMELIRGTSPCRVEVEGGSVTLWDCPYSANRMEEAGFREVAGVDGTRQCWWRGCQGVADMLGLTVLSAMDITPEAVLTALERGRRESRERERNSSKEEMAQSRGEREHPGRLPLPRAEREGVRVGS